MLSLRNSLKGKGASENKSITANASSLRKLEATLGVTVGRYLDILVIIAV